MSKQTEDEYAEATLDRLLDEATKKFNQTLGSNDPIKDES